MSDAWTDRVLGGLRQTSERLVGNLAGIVSQTRLDKAQLEAIEDALILSDLGPRAAARIRASLAAERFERGADEAAIKAAVAAEIAAILRPVAKPLDIVAFPRPQVILVIGVNGSGKTTTIGKLGHLLKEQDYGVMLAAGDTFRAAAREQLAEWGARHNVTVISQDKGDSAAVIFDAIQAAKARNIDIVLADTAGRLPTQLHLMDEIRKVKRVVAKADPAAPHETLLVLDANTGQNAVRQVKAFDEALGLTGLVITKLDGTAKGGAVAAIAREHPVPIRFIGIGEKAEDLRPFVASQFVEALFG